MAGVVLVALAANRVGVCGRPALLMLLGSAWMLAILPAALCGREYDVARLWFVLFAALLLPIASTLALIGQQLTITGPTTFDVPAYLTDDAYGFSASAIFGRIAWAHPAVHQALGMIYGWLPAAVSTCYVLNVRAGNRDADVLLKSALAGGAIAFVLYHFYPAAGPRYAFGAAFPDALPDPASLAPVSARLAMPGAPRNCTPSVHFLWVLLAMIEARRLGRGWYAVFILFAVLTAVATLALGEHYTIDLVVAVPFLRLWTPSPHVSSALWLLTAVTLVGSVPSASGRLSFISAAGRQSPAADRPRRANAGRGGLSGRRNQSARRQTARTDLPNL